MTELLLKAIVGGFMPAAIGAAVFAVMRRLGANSTVAWSLGVVSGYLGGHLGLEAAGAGVVAALHKSIAPHVARDWLPAVAMAGLAAAAVITIIQRRWFDVVSAALLGSCTPLLLLWNSKYFPSAELREAGFADDALSQNAVAGLLGSTVGLLAIAWVAWQAQLPSQRPRLRTALAVGVGLFTSATLISTGSITYPQLMGVLTASIAGCGLAAAALKMTAGVESAAPPVLLLFGGILLLATFYSALPVWYAVVLWLSATIAVGRLPARVGVIGRVLLCLLPAGAVAGLAINDALASQQQQEEESNPYLNYMPPQ